MLRKSGAIVNLQRNNAVSPSSQKKSMRHGFKLYGLIYRELLPKIILHHFPSNLLIVLFECFRLWKIECLTLSLEQVPP
jgi:hypothetical protein